MKIKFDVCPAGVQTHVLPIGSKITNVLTWTKLLNDYYSLKDGIWYKRNNQLKSTTYCIDTDLILVDRFHINSGSNAARPSKLQEIINLHIIEAIRMYRDNQIEQIIDEDKV